MKRFLNNVREVNIIQVPGKPNKYTLSGSYNLLDNEIVIGKSGDIVIGLFVYKSSELFSLSFDDFSYSFLSAENARLIAAFDTLTNSLGTLTYPSAIPNESGDQS